MKKSLIIGAFAFDENMRSGENVARVKDKFSLYLKNAAVSLISAAQTNPNSQVAFFVNAELPEKYLSLFAAHGVEIIYRPFDRFRFSGSYTWGLAFYKLCALSYALELGYERYLLIDIDTYTQSSLADLWEDAERHVLLLDINYRLANEERQGFLKESRVFFSTDEKLTCYGGEFIAGNSLQLQEFIDCCMRVYNAMVEKNFPTKYGDEFIIRHAAAEMPERIKNASGYVFRFWTGSFYVVSTCYSANAVSVLHVPAEKKYGMLHLYHCLTKNGHFPNNKRVHRMLHLKRPPIRAYIKWGAEKVNLATCLERLRV